MSDVPSVAVTEVKLSADSPKRGRGRPPLSDSEKASRQAAREDAKTAKRAAAAVARLAKSPKAQPSA